MMALDDVEKRRVYRRKKARKRHLLVFFVLFMIFALSVGAVLSVTVLFPVKYVTARGSKVYEHVQIEKQSGLTGKNIFIISEKDLEENLRKKLPFIDSVSVKRKLPDTVVISVTDAAEYACYQIDNRFYTVSRKGYVLSQYREAVENTMLIKIKNAEFDVGSLIDFKDGRVKEIVDTLVSETDKRNISVDYIDVTDKNDIRLGVMNRFTVLMGTNSFLQNKIAHLNAMIKNIDDGETGTVNLSMWSSEKSEGTFVKNSLKDKK